MPELTTTDGSTIHFSASVITAIFDHDPESGTAVTAVYGLGSGQVLISLAPAVFLNQIGQSANFAQFTCPNDTNVWVNGKSVSWVRQATTALGYPANAQSLIGVGSLDQAVIETPDQVKAAVNAHGGSI